MPEAASQGAGARLTLADEAAALRKTLARNEPWTGLQGKPVEPITVQAMLMATAWNLPDGSQMTWFNNGAIRTSPRQSERRRDRRDSPPVAQRPRRSRSRRSSRPMRTGTRERTSKPCSSTSRSAAQAARSRGHAHGDPPVRAPVPRGARRTVRDRRRAVRRVRPGPGQPAGGRPGGGDRQLRGAEPAHRHARDRSARGAVAGSRHLAPEGDRPAAGPLGWSRTRHDRRVPAAGGGRTGAVRLRRPARPGEHRGRARLRRTVRRAAAVARQRGVLDRDDWLDLAAGEAVCEEVARRGAPG